MMDLQRPSDRGPATVTNSMGKGIPQMDQMSKRSLAISIALNPSIPHRHQVMPPCAATPATRVEGVHRHTSICILAWWGTSKCTAAVTRMHRPGAGTGYAVQISWEVISVRGTDRR